MSVLFKGPFSKYTGYGKVFRNYLMGLNQLKYDYGLRPLSNHIPDYVEQSMRDKMNSSQDNTYAGILFGYGSELNQLPTKIRFLYTMYEKTMIPYQWKSNLKQADCIIVPSYFCKELFYGFNRYIYICHPGIDTNIYRPMDRTPNDIFTIGTAGVMSYRKGINLLINAFRLAFRNNNDVRLIVKTRDTRIGINTHGMNIQVIDEDWDEQKMAEYYSSLDLFVLPSLGEGFGLTSVEAALTGTPSLVTRWSGPTEYIDDKNIFGIEINGIVPVPIGMMDTDGGYWADPNVNDIAEKMKSFYNKPIRITYDNSKWKPVSATRNLLEVMNKFL